MGCNLSLLMRKLIGIGTVKQALAIASVFCLLIVLMIIAIFLPVLVGAKRARNRVELVLMPYLASRRRASGASRVESPLRVLQAG